MAKSETITSSTSERASLLAISQTDEAAQGGDERTSTMNMMTAISSNFASAPRNELSEKRRLAWKEALSEYNRLRAISDALPLDHKDEDRAIDAYCQAMDNLFATPAPSLAAVRLKYALIGERYADIGCIPTEVSDALAADLESPEVDALEAFAIAWIRRWRELGGTFGVTRNMSGELTGIIRGIPMSYVWEPGERNPLLSPHEQILHQSQHEGAHKMLEGILTLMPGGADAVRTTAIKLGLVRGLEETR